MSPRQRKGARPSKPRAPESYAGAFEQTLCWTCANTYAGMCPWFTDFTPVEGWDAERVEIKSQSKLKLGCESYIVHRCPNYVPVSTVDTAKRWEEFMKERIKCGDA